MKLRRRCIFGIGQLSPVGRYSKKVSYRRWNPRSRLDGSNASSKGEDSKAEVSGPSPNRLPPGKTTHRRYSNLAESYLHMSKTRSYQRMLGRQNAFVQRGHVAVADSLQRPETVSNVWKILRVRPYINYRSARFVLISRSESENEKASDISRSPHRFVHRLNVYGKDRSRLPTYSTSTLY